LIPPVAKADDFGSQPNNLRRRPMEIFGKLFERFLVFIYHCFDRIVIQGYLPLLTRPEHVVHFFRDVHGQYPITPQVLAKRTLEYRGWVESYARNHNIPLLKAEKGVSKEQSVLPHLQRMERRNQHGVCCIFTSMEMGSTFSSKMPRFPTDDPDYRIIRRVPSRYLHYYFYIRVPVDLRPSGITGGRRQTQRRYHRKAPELLDLAAGSEVLRKGPQGREPEARILHQSDRILQELHLQAELPHPQDL
jgi:hypothetical protein